MERHVKSIKIVEVVKQDYTYERTIVSYFIPTGSDAPDREYAPKLGDPSNDVNKYLRQVEPHIAELCAIPSQVHVTCAGVEWKTVDDTPSVRFTGCMGHGVDYKTQFIHVKKMPEALMGALNNLAISALEQVDGDVQEQAAQTKLDFLLDMDAKDKAKDQAAASV